MKTVQIASLLTFILLLVAGCAGSGGPVASEADLGGEIVEVTPANEGDVVGRVRVEAPVEGADRIDPYIVTVTDDTELYAQNAVGERQEIGFDGLTAGQRVDLWFAGPVRESYPMQVDAAQLVVLPPGANTS
jgi:beta-N-acetylhexosaminidase